VGGTAILASQLGVDHPNRWLASGTAIGVQSLILVAIDLVGVMRSGRYHERFLRGFTPSVSVTSSQSVLKNLAQDPEVGFLAAHDRASHLPV
jgi:hypothetical protein